MIAWQEKAQLIACSFRFRSYKLPPLRTISNIFVWFAWKSSSKTQWIDVIRMIYISRNRARKAIIDIAIHFVFRRWRMKSGNEQHSYVYMSSACAHAQFNLMPEKSSDFSKWFFMRFFPIPCTADVWLLEGWCFVILRTAKDSNRAHFRYRVYNIIYMCDCVSFKISSVLSLFFQCKYNRCAFRRIFDVSIVFDSKCVYIVHFDSVNFSVFSSTFTRTCRSIPAVCWRRPPPIF